MYAPKPTFNPKIQPGALRVGLLDNPHYGLRGPQAEIDAKVQEAFGQIKARHLAVTGFAMALLGVTGFIGARKFGATKLAWVATAAGIILPPLALHGKFKPDLTLLKGKLSQWNEAKKMVISKKPIRNFFIKQMKRRDGLFESEQDDKASWLGDVRKMRTHLRDWQRTHKREFTYGSADQRQVGEAILTRLTIQTWEFGELVKQVANGTVEYDTQTQADLAKLKLRFSALERVLAGHTVEADGYILDGENLSIVKERDLDTLFQYGEYGWPTDLQLVVPERAQVEEEEGYWWESDDEEAGAFFLGTPSDGTPIGHPPLSRTVQPQYDDPGGQQDPYDLLFEEEPKVHPQDDDEAIWFPSAPEQQSTLFNGPGGSPSSHQQAWIRVIPPETHTDEMSDEERG